MVSVSPGVTGTDTAAPTMAMGIGHTDTGTTARGIARLDFTELDAPTGVVARIVVGADGHASNFDRPIANDAR
jgi:hypothetical protein